MVKDFSDLTGEGTIKENIRCIFCQEPFEQNKEVEEGFCSHACEWNYSKTWDRFFGFKEDS